MRYYSARSRLKDGGDAIEEVLHSLRAGGCESADMLALFVTSHHRESVAQMAGRVEMDQSPRVLIGCTCEGVIGADEEIEREPGVALLAAQLPGVGLRPFAINPLEWNDALSRGEVLETIVGTDTDVRGCLLLADPFSTPIEDLLGALDTFTALGPIFGGMASGAYQPGANALILNDGLYTEGCVGVTFSGPLHISTVVSQGCRPVGERFLVTGSHQNLITSLGNRPALEVAEEVIQQFEAPDALELFVGVAMSEYQDEYNRGDFLIRNILGADRDAGILAIGDTVRTGQTIQFQIRDADSASEDLKELLTPHADSGVAGALMFSCNGRGTRMFDTPCHDIRGFLDVVQGVPAAGFFAMGELGPIGRRSYLHGQTASIALFSPPTGEAT